MVNTFCTIVSADFLPFSYALYDSLSKFDSSIKLNVLVSDSENLMLEEARSDNIIIHSSEDLIEESTIGRKIWNKYNTEKTQSELRWALKPVFIEYLLKIGYEKVIFSDADTFYYSNYTFLFDELDKDNVLLTPHWRAKEPENNLSNFDHQFAAGLYNGGFVGVNQKAIEVMEWWGNLCYYKCELNPKIGYFGDQTYMNLMPIYFDKVKILRHQGCNVANWNQIVCQRTLINGEVKINKKWPVVFIHYTKSTIRGIVMKQDELLRSFLNVYVDSLAKYGYSMELKNFITPNKRYSLRRRLKNLLNSLS